MALAKWQFRRQRADPSAYALVLPDDRKFWFRFERIDRQALRNGRQAYWSYNVDRVLFEVGEYVYGDSQSEQILADLDKQPMPRDEVIVEDKAVYSG